MALDPASRARFNLEKANILLLDDTPMGMAILVQIVTGLGAKKIHRCTDVDMAKQVASNTQLDLAIVDALPPSGAGYDFVKWLRNTAQEPNCYTPVLMTTAHTPRSDINRARDCGSHLIVKKPIAPIVLLERIIWVSKEGRPFLFSGDYVGPDRRFRDQRPPNGVGRRREDQPPASGPPPANTSPDEETASSAPSPV